MWWTNRGRRRACAVDLGALAAKGSHGAEIASNRQRRDKSPIRIYAAVSNNRS